MRKLIYLENQQNMIVCDNPKCDYVIPNPTKNPLVDIRMYINKPCPECGENLLTEKDYHDWIKFKKVVNWVNKWFSWITIFMPKNKKYTNASAHIHNSVDIQTHETKELD